jgi:hypothetical protein
MPKDNERDHEQVDFLEDEILGLELRVRAMRQALISVSTQLEEVLNLIDNAMRSDDD